MTTRFYRWLVRSAVALALLASFLTSPGFAAAAPLTQAQSEALLKAVISAGSNEKWLTSYPGISAPTASRISAHRKAGKSFGSIDEFRTVSQISDGDFEKLAALFIHVNPAADAEERQEVARMASGRTATPVATKGKNFSAQEKTTSIPSASKDSGGGKLDLAVQGGYYSTLPGYDLTKIDEAKRKSFLDTVNRETCNCGCSGETLGYCLVNDPGCPVVKARVKKIYADIVGGAPTAPAH
ncbi:MAG TPA: helix-hairpin-helix domain-containing protein [Verrucomicrobiae bacterium]|nr:helix-hairpin-helix domain-containing protein [Verrucomicrobiae bacterium]